MLPSGWPRGQSDERRSSDGVAGAAANQSGLVAVHALERHELGGEVVAVDRFLAAVAHRARQVAVAAAVVADRLRTHSLHQAKQ